MISKISLFLLVTASLLDHSQAQPESSPDAFIDKLVRDSQKHRRQRALPPDDPLFRAEIECAELAGDVSEYSRHLRLVMHGYAERGLWDEAEYLTTRMVGSGVPLGLAELALTSAKKLRKEEAMVLVGKAQEQLPLALGQNREIVIRDCALTCLLCGKREQAEVMRQTLTTEESWILAAAFLDADLVETPPQLDQTRELITKVGVTHSSAARYLISAGDLHLRAGRRDVGKAFLIEAILMANHPKFLKAMDRLLEAATIAQLHGLTEERDQALNLYRKYASSLTPGLDWKPASHVKLALTLDALGNKEQAQAEMKLAEAAAPQVIIVQAAEGMVEIARAWQKLGDSTRSESWLHQATRVGMANEHPRARGAAGVLICLHYASFGKVIPEDITKELRLAKERGGDS